ncbi:MAG: hypothetical protein JW874_11520, partial [Spirochaetales bacterium]|nr:hypothetical protein [Spirochaetales bacterium]
MEKTVFLLILFLFTGYFYSFADNNDPAPGKKEPVYELSAGVLYEIPLTQWESLWIGAVDFKINLYQKNNICLFTGIEVPQWLDIEYGYIGYYSDSNIFFGINYKIPLSGHIYLVPALAVQLFPLNFLASLFSDEDFIFVLGSYADAALEIRLTKNHVFYLKSGITVLSGLSAADIPSEDRIRLKIPVELGYSFRF